MLVALWSPKGGSGTSVVAAALAVVAAGRGNALLADFGGDQPAILGLPPLTGFGSSSEQLSEQLPFLSAPGLTEWLAAGPSAPTEWLDQMAVPVVPGLSLLPCGPGGATSASPEAGAALAVALRDSGLVVVDAGSGAGVVSGAVDGVLEVADSVLMVIRPCYLALRRAVSDSRLAHTSGVILVEDAGRALDAADVAAVVGVPVVGRVPVRAEIARSVDAGVLRDRLPSPLAVFAGSVLDRLGDLAGGRWAA